MNPVLTAENLTKTFKRETGESVKALDGISLTIPTGTLTGLVGPDGAGKTTLIRLAAGLIRPDQGRLEVLNLDTRSSQSQLQARLGYMPQRFGLYEELTVQQNLDFYARLHGVSIADREVRYPRLMAMTGLGDFTKRLAGRLSGGMKQKLGLACTLIRVPEFLLLDEPTVGVDPLSRKELWEIIFQLIKDGLTVVISTSYLEEAENCGKVIVLHEGRLLAEDEPRAITSLAKHRVFLAAPKGGVKARDLQAELLGRPGLLDAVPQGGQVRLVAEPQTFESLSREIDPLATVTEAPPRFEDGFMILLKGMRTEGEAAVSSLSVQREPEKPVSSVSKVEVRDLVRRFGDFTAVDHVNFEVKQGEIFGLLGPNGAGKTTTFRMLCGLLPASGGTLKVAGIDVRDAPASARARLGYVAQKYSLYGQLSVLENLDFFASTYGLRGADKSRAVSQALEEFDLEHFAALPSGQLPGGFKQRLAMAAALLHQPDLLFLDEPTSGADPLARREFWKRITFLAQHGITVVVTTHFMEEAEYCDHAVIMDAGRVLAQGTPAEIRSHAPSRPGHEPEMEDAFLAIVERARTGQGEASQ